MRIVPITYAFHLGETRGSHAGKEIYADEAILLWRALHCPLLGGRYTLRVIKYPMFFASRAWPGLQLSEVRNSDVLNIERRCPKQNGTPELCFKNKNCWAIERIQ